MTNLIVRTGPQEYECGRNVLETLPERLEERHVSKVLLVHGERSWEKAQPFLQTLFDSSLEVVLHPFSGETTYEEIDLIAEKLKREGAQGIIGVGGGKLIDAVKYAGVKVPHTTIAIIPTLASNCAPWAPLSVVYNEEGEMVTFDTHPRQNDLLLVDPELIIDAPVEYFIAGIGDTLAKWYESDLILTREENQNNAFLQASRASARICREVILTHGLQAVEDVRRGEATEAFIQVAETIIGVAGLVGGFGDGYARSTIAHAVHDALTTFPNTHEVLHGSKVAYGILVQLAYEDNQSELNTLQTLYESLGLPQKLSDVHLSLDRDVEQLAEAIAHNKSLIHSEYESVSKSEIKEAILQLEGVRK